VAANLLSHVLGGGMASRLFMELRERHGLCYQVGSYLTHYAASGSLQISAGCAPGHARELVKRTLGECQKLRALGVTRAELERAKLQAKTNLVFGQESAASRMFSLAHQAIHQGEIQDLDQSLREIDGVDQDRLNQLARELLDPYRLGLATLGTKRGSEIRAQELVA
jgi:predicted Zn-dependent peptidase